MKYVYLLKSIKDPNQSFLGYTEDLNGELIDHNSWKHHETAPNVPWEIELAIRFRDHLQAQSYHRYLASTAGQKHIIKHLRPHRTRPEVQMGKRLKFQPSV